MAAILFLSFEVVNVTLFFLLLEASNSSVVFALLKVFKAMEPKGLPKVASRPPMHLGTLGLRFLIGKRLRIRCLNFKDFNRSDEKFR